MKLYNIKKKNKKKTSSLEDIKKNITIKNYSLINKFLKERKVNKEFILILSSLSLEDLIALKLESTSRILKGRMLSHSFFTSIKYMILEAIIKYILSISERKEDLELNLGIKYQTLRGILKKIEIEIVKGD